MTELDRLREEVQGCRDCELYKGTTQAVFGEGLAKSQAMFVGEQPGDREDREGHPFVGPAGRIFDKALVEAGIDRKLVYVTNTVKHFHYEQRGKRRIHSAPRRAHQRLPPVVRCRTRGGEAASCSCASARCRRRRSSDARSR